jgi:hypothetical protein
LHFHRGAGEIRWTGSPKPGIDTCQAMFSSDDQDSGIGCSPVTPHPFGPRNWQKSAAAAGTIAAKKTSIQSVLRRTIAILPFRESGRFTWSLGMVSATSP